MLSSRQIRPPIYSMKQSKLRRRRVIRYAMLYFTMFVVFVALIAGPVVVGNMDLLPEDLGDNFNIGEFRLMQPDLENDDTRDETETGTGAADYSGVYTPSGEAGDDPSDDAFKIRLF